MFSAARDGDIKELSKGSEDKGIGEWPGQWSRPLRRPFTLMRGDKVRTVSTDWAHAVCKRDGTEH